MEVEPQQQQPAQPHKHMQQHEDKEDHTHTLPPQLMQPQVA